MKELGEFQVAARAQAVHGMPEECTLGFSLAFLTI